MDEKEIVRMYTQDRYTLRHLAELFDTDHHNIKRVLVRNKIPITRRNTLKTFTPEHRRKISDSRKKLKANGWVPYNKGLKTATRKNGKELLLKNMQTHIRFDVSLKWLSQFDDIDKLKFLNKAITKRGDRWNVETEWYKSYVMKFYYDKQFNDIYSKWVASDKQDIYLRPTIDHITPKAHDGSNELTNLMFLTWFENRAKNDMPLDEWIKMKENISEYFI